MSKFWLTVGLTNNIGVSNFRIQEIEKVLAIAKHKPVINQAEFHAYCQTPNLAKYLSDNDILFGTYGPLTPLVAKNDGPVTPVVDELAKKYGKTPAQVASRSENPNVGDSFAVVISTTPVFHYIEFESTTTK